VKPEVSGRSQLVPDLLKLGSLFEAAGRRSMRKSGGFWSASIAVVYRAPQSLQALIGESVDVPSSGAGAAGARFQLRRTRGEDGPRVAMRFGRRFASVVRSLGCRASVGSGRLVLHGRPR
jgi:hypothetical protein